MFSSGGEHRISTWRERSRRRFPFEPDGRSILDVGSSNGEIAAALRARGAQMTCVDLTFIAASHAAHVHGLRAVQSDALSLPFRDGAFDASTAVGVLHHTPSMERALAEMARVTRPGGDVAVMLYARGTPYQLVYRVFRRVRERRAPGDPLHLPAWAIVLLRPALQIMVGQRLTTEQTTTLVADQVLTPVATFHAPRDVIALGDRHGLVLTRRERVAMYGDWYYWRRADDGEATSQI